MSPFDRPPTRPSIPSRRGPHLGPAGQVANPEPASLEDFTRKGHARRAPVLRLAEQNSLAGANAGGRTPGVTEPRARLAGGFLRGGAVRASGAPCSNTAERELQRARPQGDRTAGLPTTASSPDDLDDLYKEPDRAVGRAILDSAEQELQRSR